MPPEGWSTWCWSAPRSVPASDVNLCAQESWQCSDPLVMCWLCMSTPLLFIVLLWSSLKAFPGPFSSLMVVLPKQACPRAAKALLPTCPFTTLNAMAKRFRIQSRLAACSLGAFKGMTHHSSCGTELQHARVALWLKRLSWASEGEFHQNQWKERQKALFTWLLKKKITDLYFPNAKLSFGRS